MITNDMIHIFDASFSTIPIGLKSPVNIKTTGIAKTSSVAQNACSDQDFTFSPSRGPKGSMLNKPKMRFAVSQNCIPNQINNL